MAEVNSFARAYDKAEVKKRTAARAAGRSCTKAFCPPTHNAGNGRKGIILTLVTFLAFAGIFSMMGTLILSEQTRAGDASASISSQRVFHYWKSVSENIYGLSNISTAKNGNTFEVNDSLPAENSIEDILEDYADFIGQYFADKTVDIHFEDESGNEIQLESISPKITLSPMNITYGWDSWGKNEMQIMSPVDALGYIYSINMTVNFVNQTIANNSVTWSPYKDCRNNYPCLLLYLYVSDGTKTISSAQTTFDLSRGSKSDDIACGSGNCWLRFRVGPWGGGDPQNVLKIELHNLNITTNTKITLNTTGFYSNFPAKLFVGTAFASKLDYI